jgi:hypothetical protein
MSNCLNSRLIIVSKEASCARRARPEESRTYQVLAGRNVVDEHHHLNGCINNDDVGQQKAKKKCILFAGVLWGDGIRDRNWRQN